MGVSRTSGETSVDGHGKVKLHMYITEAVD